MKNSTVNCKKPLTKEEIVARATTHHFVSIKDLLIGLKNLQRLYVSSTFCPGAKKKQLAQALLELRLWNHNQHTRSVRFL